MAFLDKEYKFVRHENFDKFLMSVGVPEDRVRLMESIKPSQTFSKNADGTYTATNTHSGPPKTTVFTSGVELEDVIGVDNIPIKTTYTVDGNTITQTINSSRGSATFTREYNGDDLTVTITSDNFDGVAKRFYKA